ncbi:hypothetical protein G7077_01375 [Sphingomonas piscis]|uniref:Uncharacterized protein n=1 Tax=Sphingomonas piscis TaxID=2714943 RepID=A0A6G7YLZ3_9SPHN|nr:hypothetical protein [Sphingomonas piscis]QIK77763.1 hypothetical protein G7077_01375 [Sphingomonas piscis]
MLDPSSTDRRAPPDPRQEARARRLEAMCGSRADRYTGSRIPTPAQAILLVRIGAALRTAPRVRLCIGHDPEGEQIRGWIDRTSFGLRSIFHRALSVLPIPRDPGDVLAAPGQATLRRMVRKADKLGITCRLVTSPEERSGRKERAAAFEKAHPNLRYRRRHPNLDGLDETELWIAAFAADGRALAVSVTPTSGNVGLLRFFRVLEASPDATLARYSMTAALAQVLSERGIRFLVDNVHPLSVSSSLRHFATMVGFRIMPATIDDGPVRAGERAI